MADETPRNSGETPLETLSDRELILRGVRILEHLDLMMHDVHNLTGRAAPLLDRFTRGGKLLFGTGKAGKRNG